MHSTALSQAWVKNVYSLWGEGVAKCVNLYTGSVQSLLPTIRLRVQPTHYTQVVDTFPPSIYTPKICHLTDKNHYLPTVSTAPTIKKKR